MRPRRDRARWLFVVAVLAAPGCLFRPIFHPPSSQGGDASRASDASSSDSAYANDASAFDVASDVGSPPVDDCQGLIDSATGMYYPDAHHADGALCEIPSSDASSSEAPAIDATDATIEDTAIDATVEDTSTDASVDDVTADAGDEPADDAGDEPADDAGPTDPDL